MNFIKVAIQYFIFSPRQTELQQSGRYPPVLSMKLSAGELLLCNVVGCVRNIPHFIEQGLLHFLYSFD